MFARRFRSGSVLTLLVLLSTVAPAPAETDRLPTAEQLLDSRDVYEALRTLGAACSEQEKEARQEFYKSKRKINRSLGSLDRDSAERSEDAKNAQRRFAKRLHEIQKQCERTRSQIIKQHVTRDNRERATTREPMEKPTLIIPPPPSKKPTLAKPEKKAAPAPKAAKAEKAPKPPKPEKPAGPPVDYGNLVRNFEFHGRASQTGIYRVNSPTAWTNNRTELYLEQKTNLSEQTAFRASERLAMDGVIRRRNDQYDGTGTYEHDARESEGELRDAYMDLSRGNYDIRLGKQQVVWGEAVTLFIADVVNGKDLREFILPDFDRIRMPQWSALVTRTAGAFVVEGVASIPRMNELAPRGSEFEVPLGLPANVPTNVQTPERPADNAENLDWGGRLSYLIGGWDLGAFYLYSWDKNPILFREVTFTGLNVQPEYRRQTYTGFTFSKDAWFDSIVKGEFLARPDAYLATADPLATRGVIRNTTYDGMLGVDRTYFDSWDVNLQVIHRWTKNADPLLLFQPDERTFLAAWISRDFWDTCTMEYTVTFDPARSDRMHRPKLIYRFSPRIVFQGGADFLDGHAPQGLFSPYDPQDRAYLTALFHF